MASSQRFVSSIRLKPADMKNGTAEELVLRFFAFLECYKEFDHSVKNFLNDYMRNRAGKSLSADSVKLFNAAFSAISSNLPNGIIRGARSVTPVNLYEAIAVGTALAIKNGRTPNAITLQSLLSSVALRKLTTGGTNNKKMVTGRIDFVSNALEHV